MYEFKLAYPNPLDPNSRGSVNNVPLTKQALKAHANKFVRSLIEFSGTLDHLPDHRWITLQLQYLDECPDDYQPLYFKSVDGRSPLGFEPNSKTMKIRIGSIKTDHHDLQVKFSGLESLDIEHLLEPDSKLRLGVPSSSTSATTPTPLAVKQQRQQESSLFRATSTSSQMIIAREDEDDETQQEQQQQQQLQQQQRQQEEQIEQDEHLSKSISDMILMPGASGRSGRGSKRAPQVTMEIDEVAAESQKEEDEEQTAGNEATSSYTTIRDHV